MHLFWRVTDIHFLNQQVFEFLKKLARLTFYGSPKKLSQKSSVSHKIAPNWIRTSQNICRHVELYDPKFSDPNKKKWKFYHIYKKMMKKNTKPTCKISLNMIQPTIDSKKCGNTPLFPKKSKLCGNNPQLIFRKSVRTHHDHFFKKSKLL